MMARESKHALLKQEEFLPMPESAFDACSLHGTRSNSLSLVRFKNNDYSVPVRHAHHEVIVKGYMDRIEICTRAGERIATHARLWSKESVSYDPRHYLALLKRKPGALDHAAPLFDFKLPSCFDTLRRRFESHKGHAGTKEYIEVLLLLERHSVRRVADAITRMLELSMPSISIVRMYCVPEETPETSTFSLDGREHLQGIEVHGPDLQCYASLLDSEGAA